MANHRPNVQRHGKEGWRGWLCSTGVSLLLTPGAAHKVFPSDFLLSWEEIVFWDEQNSPEDAHRSSTGPRPGLQEQLSAVPSVGRLGCPHLLN